MAVHGRRRRRRRRRKPAQRSVYIIARPLQAAGRLSIFSDGKFPVCHWGLLVTRRSREEVLSQWMRYCETTDPSYLPPWGTMIELNRLPDNTNIYNVSTDFGLKDWYAICGPSISIMYVGETEFSDANLTAKGISKKVQTSSPMSSLRDRTFATSLQCLYQQLSELCSLSC